MRYHGCASLSRTAAGFSYPSISIGDRVGGLVRRFLSVRVLYIHAHYHYPLTCFVSYPQSTPPKYSTGAEAGSRLKADANASSHARPLHLQLPMTCQRARWRCAGREGGAMHVHSINNFKFNHPGRARARAGTLAFTIMVPSSIGLSHIVSSKTRSLLLGRLG